MPEIIHAYKNKLDKRRRINHRLNFCATGKAYTPFFAKLISASRCLGNALMGGKKDSSRFVIYDDSDIPAACDLLFTVSYRAS